MTNPALLYDYDLARFELYQTLPEGCIAFPVLDNRCLPMIEPGEIAVVDMSDCELCPGGLFLRRIVICDGRIHVYPTEVLHWVGRARDQDGSPYWMTIAHNRPRSRDQWASWSANYGPVPLADGPLYADRLRNSIIGRIVGILKAVGAHSQARPALGAEASRTPLLTPL